MRTGEDAVNATELKDAITAMSQPHVAELRAAAINHRTDFPDLPGAAPTLLCNGAEEYMDEVSLDVAVTVEPVGEGGRPTSGWARRLTLGPPTPRGAGRTVHGTATQRPSDFGMRAPLDTASRETRAVTILHYEL